MKPTALLLSMAVFLSAPSLNAGPSAALNNWRVPSNAVPIEMAAGLNSLLRTKAGAGMLEQSHSLKFIGGLYADSDAHRRMLGLVVWPEGFEERLAGALRYRGEDALAGVCAEILTAYRDQHAAQKIGEAVAARADEIVAAVHGGAVGVDELSAAAEELAPFAAGSPQAQAVADMAKAAAAAGQIEPAQALAADYTMHAVSVPNRYAQNALEMMARAGRDMSPSIDNLKRFTNQFQVEALQALVDNGGYQIYDKLDAILQFDNEHQVAALKAMVDDDRTLSPALAALATLDNEHQAAAVALLATTDQSIAANMDGIAQIKGPLPVQALSLMAEHKRTIEPSMEAIARISNEHQVRGLRALVKAPVTYRVSDKIETVLAFTTWTQPHALELLVSRSRPVRWLLPALAAADSPEKASMIKAIAENISEPAFKLGKTEKIAIALFTLFAAFYFLAAAVAGAWPTGLSGLGLSLAGLGLTRRGAFRAVVEARKANRKWLSDRPDIEKAFGSLDNPELLSPRS
ncbi:MAG: hypothetical protein HYZ74_05915 [Elusimicrobia bacterium]|nr:hypothetical protein [Elusimicrobiota bacterium]